MVMDYSNASFDVLLEISKYLPEKDVIACSMVCKNWKKTLDTHKFWIQYFKLHNHSIEPSSLQLLYKVPFHKLKKIVAKRGFNRNLIEDNYNANNKPEFDKRWSDYNKKNRGVYSNSFSIQTPPNFFDNSDRRFDLDECSEPFLSCLVCSYQSVERHITIDLEEYGFDTEVLNLMKPTIVVTEYYTNRWDCACIYTLKSSLAKDKKFKKPISDKAENTFSIDQWADEYWRKAEQVWKNYSDDIKLIKITSSGSDRQFWAGDYGVKIAGTSLVVKLEFNDKEDITDEIYDASDVYFDENELN